MLFILKALFILAKHSLRERLLSGDPNLAWLRQNYRAFQVPLLRLPISGIPARNSLRTRRDSDRTNAHYLICFGPLMPKEFGFNA
jgi:hypothetical protein